MSDSVQMTAKAPGKSARVPTDKVGRSSILAYQVVFLIGILAAWQFVSSTGIILRPIVASSPLDVWKAFILLASSGELWSNLAATLVATAIALVLAGSVGIVAGLSLGLMPVFERVVTPFLDALNATPRIAVAPIFIIVFGIGLSAKVALAFTVVVFMVTSAARAGIHAANPDVLRLMTVMGATKVQIFFKVLLPVATPSIFAGLRLGLIYSLLGVVTSELLASRNGLGQLIALYSGTFQLDRVYAIIIVLILISGILNAVFTAIERRLTHWKTLDDA